MSGSSNKCTAALIALFVLTAHTATAVPIEWPTSEGGNGHYYELTTGLISTEWREQHLAALSLSYAGMSGHLATITSQDELNWISAQVFAPLLPRQTVVYLGGWNDGFLNNAVACYPNYMWPLGSWHWITGEEWAFAAWATDQPNVASNGCTTEFALSYLHYWDTYLGFNNLNFTYRSAGAARLVEYDNLSCTALPPLNHPIKNEQETWGALKAAFR